jgi:hypothetical protein
MRQITDEQLEQIGLLADKANNFTGAAQLPLPPKMHVEQLSIGMADIRDELRGLYQAITGDNPWEHHP